MPRPSARSRGNRRSLLPTRLKVSYLHNDQPNKIECLQHYNMSPTIHKRSIYTFPGSRHIPPSLLDQCLKYLAKNISSDDTSFLSAISDLPLHLKEHLLSYIAAYRSQGLTKTELHALILDHGNGDRITTSSSYIRQLDLSRSIGSSLLFEDISRICTFPSLTHLCLSDPGPRTSWCSFLAFAEGIPSLTHLSLANWPEPRDKIGNYSGFSQTPHRLLRRLSDTLINLQFLSLEGCNDWFHALLPCSDIDIGWGTSWRHLVFLNLSQGPMPVGVSLEGGPRTENWIRGEVLVRQIEEHINLSRKELDAPPIYIEHGWDPTNFMIGYLVDMAYGRMYSTGPPILAMPTIPDTPNR